VMMEKSIGRCLTITLEGKASSNQNLRQSNSLQMAELLLEGLLEFLQEPISCLNQQESWWKVNLLSLRSVRQIFLAKKLLKDTNGLTPSLNFNTEEELRLLESAQMTQSMLVSEDRLHSLKSMVLQEMSKRNH
jgi:hypothetical protein